MNKIKLGWRKKKQKKRWRKMSLENKLIIEKESKVFFGI
jgi:hypothetical protein